MTKVELHRLAGAIATLRPDWAPQSLQTFLERNFAHRPLRDIAVALTIVAVDPDTATPARVLEPGPWWQAASTRDVPMSRNTCRDHPLHGLRLDARTGHEQCAGCWADEHGDPSQPVPQRQGVPPAPDVRAQLLDAIHPQRATDPERATPDDATAAACDATPTGSTGGTS